MKKEDDRNREKNLNTYFYLRVRRETKINLILKWNENENDKYIN